MRFRSVFRLLSLLTAGLSASLAAQAQASRSTAQRAPTAAQQRQRQAQAVPIEAGPAPAAPAAPSAAGIEARANALTANMQQNLGLTPAQTEKVRLINRRGVERVESLRLRYRANPAKMQSMINDVSDSRLASLKDVLAPAQFDKYQRKREEKMGLPNTQGVQGNTPPGLGGGE